MLILPRLPIAACIAIVKTGQFLYVALNPQLTAVVDDGKAAIDEAPLLFHNRSYRYHIPIYFAASQGFQMRFRRKCEKLVTTFTFPSPFYYYSMKYLSGKYVTHSLLRCFQLSTYALNLKQLIFRASRIFSLHGKPLYDWGCSIEGFLRLSVTSTICSWQFTVDFSMSRGSTVSVRPETVLRGHEDSVNCVCFYSNDILASGSVDGVLKIWSLNSRRAVSSIGAHAGSILSVNSSYSSSSVISCGRDGLAKMWDLDLQSLSSVNSPVATFQTGAKHFCNSSCDRSYLSGSEC